jgi:hypothetical protein
MTMFWTIVELIISVLGAVAAVLFIWHTWHEANDTPSRQIEENLNEKGR